MASGYANTATPLPLAIELTETGLPGGNLYRFTMGVTKIFASHPNTLAYSVYADATDAAFGTGMLLDSTSLTDTGTSSTNALAAIPIGVMFSMTEVFVYTSVAAATRALNSTIDGSVNVAIREPAAIALLGGD